MRPLSAIDTISPAVQRTMDFLFRPFRWGTYLKLGLVAILTEGTWANLRSSSHTSAPTAHGSPNLPFLHLSLAMWIAAIAAIALALVLCFFLFYLVTRLRFAFFHCLSTNTRLLGPGWRLYRDRAGRFFWLNVVVGLCFILLAGLIALPFAGGFWRLLRETAPGGHPPIGPLLSLVLPLIPFIALFALAAVVSDIVLRDWMLPHYALDDATAGEAWSRVRAAIVAEKRQFLAYSLLRLVLPTLALIALSILLVVPGLVLAGSVAAIEYGVHSTFVGSTGGSAVAGILLEVFFGVLTFGFAILAAICLGGPLSTGLREYALIFYGSRYPALGNMLFPLHPPLPPNVSMPGNI